MLGASCTSIALESADKSGRSCPTGVATCTGINDDAIQTMRYSTTGVQRCRCSDHCINRLRKITLPGFSLLGDLNCVDRLSNLASLVQPVNTAEDR